MLILLCVLFSCLSVKRRCHVVCVTHTRSVVTCQDLNVIVSKWSWRIRMWPGLQTLVWVSWIRVEGWRAGPVCLVLMLFFGRTESNLFCFRWNHFFAPVAEASVIFWLFFCELKVRLCGGLPSLPVCSLPVLTSLSLILSSFHLGFPTWISGCEPHTQTCEQLCARCYLEWAG